MKRILNQFLVVSLFLVGTGGPSLRGEDPDPKENRKASKSDPREEKAEKRAEIERHVAVLGVSVDDLHPALATHLPDTIALGQGVVVADVAENSPAENAGVELHDILISYDDQKLFNADQLAKLVRADTPGRHVALGVVRAGKLVVVSLSLGDRVVTERSFRRGPPHPGAHPPFSRWWSSPWLPRWSTEEENNHWKNFDSLTLKSLGDDKFSASIEHTDKDGKTQKHMFEGTREGIRKQIEADRDMNDFQRGHLLESLGLGTADQWDQEFLHPDF